jgi:membrane-bound metal-dependent hydrolase YbcI (DUF457 family)
MVYALGHLIGAWVAGKGYEYITGRTLDRYLWFFLLFGGILPDIDFIFQWTILSAFHRTITHSFFFVLFAGTTIYSTFLLLHDTERISFAITLSAGILVHLFLDSISLKGVPLLWPYPAYFSFFTGIQFSSALPEFFNSSAQVLKQRLQFAVIDMGIGTFWIFYLWWRKRIRF